MLYLFSLIGFWPVQIVSIALSLHMARKGLFNGTQKGVVIALSTLELLGWAFLPSFAWFQVCYSEYYYSTWNYRCDYYGWIAIVVWWGTLLFALPRAIITFKARNNAAQVTQCCAH